jgi:hypothetical protein
MGEVNRMKEGCIQDFCLPIVGFSFNEALTRNDNKRQRLIKAGNKRRSNIMFYLESTFWLYYSNLTVVVK